LTSRTPLLVSVAVLVSFVMIMSLGASVAGAQTPVAGTSITIPVGGGTGTAGQVTLTAPAGAFAEGATVNYQQQPAQSATGFDSVGVFFSLNSSVDPKAPLSLAVNFSKTECGDPLAVRLHKWNASTSKWEPASTTVAAAAGGASGQYTATASVDSFGLFALLGPACAGTVAAPVQLPKTGAPIIPAAVALLGGCGILGGGFALRRR
jgi:LPXTG-motif cell wall-anchored protein